MDVYQLIYDLRSNDKKMRYNALKNIMALSRSKKRKQKKELLKVLNEKSFSNEWEERYLSMMGLSRYMWGNEKLDDLKEAYNNALRLLEDEIGGVRIVARITLEHFRDLFISCVYCGKYNNFDRAEIVRVWTNSLFLLWDKTKLMKAGKMQYHLMRCIETLFRPDMEDNLNNRNDCKKYAEICNKIGELNWLYNEGRGEYGNAIKEDC